MVSRPSAEAEYRAMAQGTCELLWVHSLLAELGFPVSEPSILFCDNKSTIMLASDSILHERTNTLKLMFILFVKKFALELFLQALFVLQIRRLMYSQSLLDHLC